MVFVKIHPHKLSLSIHKGKSIPINHQEQNMPDLPIFKLHFKTPKKSGLVSRKLSQGKNVRVKVNELNDITDHNGGSLFSMLKSVGKTLINNPAVQDVAKGLINQGISSGIDALGARVGAPSAVTDIAKGLSSQLVDAGINTAVQKANESDSGASATGSGFRRMKKGGAMLASKAYLKAGNGFSDMFGFGLSSNPNIGIGGKNPTNEFNSNKHKMEYVRSFKKNKNGGSFLPLGN